MRNDKIYNMTNQLFADSLKSNLKKKSIDKISIKELCDECSLSRRTFYRHFKDIYDLVEWIYRKDINDQINCYKDFPHWKDCLLYLFNYFYINQDMTHVIIKYTSLYNLEEFLYTSVYKFVKDVIEQESSKYPIEKSDVDFLINFYTLSFVSLLIQWMKRGLKEAPNKVVDNIALVFQGSIVRINNK